MSDVTYLGNPNLKKANVQQEWTKKELLEYSEKVKSQDYHQRVAGDKIYVKVFCVPKGVEKE